MKSSFLVFSFFCKIRKQTASTHGDVTEQWGNAVLPSSAEPIPFFHSLLLPVFPVPTGEQQGQTERDEVIEVTGRFEGLLAKGLREGAQTLNRWASMF